MQQTILGIDPGTKYMGIVVLHGVTLRSYGVHTLRNGEKPHDVMAQARRIVLKYIATYAPTIVAIEKPLPVATKRAAVLSVISQELHNRARELVLVVREIAPRDVRQAVVGNPKATKLQVARALVDRGFEELRARLPQAPKRSALGLHPRDRYWLHVFDALAVAVAASSRPRRS